MRVLGIITEYNPFHNGHMYHLQQSKELCSADYTICVMSGNFIQRGEPALVNKHARAEIALLSGVDLVIELPVVYAMSTAEFFASASVRILDSLGVVNYLCFGSESGNIKELDLIASILCDEPLSFKTSLKKYLDEGYSFPSAREKALISTMEKSNLDCSIMGYSNNILGIEYLKALKRINSKICPLTIGRIANSYNSEEIAGSISSATSIRKLISKTNYYKTSNYIRENCREEKDVEANDDSCRNEDILSKLVPEASARILSREFQKGRGPVFPFHFESMLFAALRKMKIEDIASLPYVTEGLENRIKAVSERVGTLDELIAGISTKRYPRTTIQRILFSIITGLTAKDLDDFNRNGGPQYIRVLGFNRKGRELLAQIKKRATLPIIVKTADWKNSENVLLRRMLEIESSATDIYVLGYSNPEFRKAGQEFTQNLVRIGDETD
ncbi:MAG TPA: nucleotidyltransferase [Clostridiaceae bacterium]|nr:nucleotidyltransferase [Clostridiaceae bacterium]